MTSSETAFSSVLDSRITQVTVYSNQARILRSGKIELAGNEQELVIEDLPASLQTESLRVSGQGDVAVRILGVRSERKFSTEAVSPQLAELDQQLENLQREQRGLGDRRKAALLNQGFVQQLSEGLVKPLSRSLSRQQISTEETAALMAFMGDRYSNQASEILTVDVEQKELERKIKAVEQQVKQLKVVRPRESQRVVVAIALQAFEGIAPSGSFELTLSYMINNASWKPIYDLDVVTAERSLTLDYLAEVQQTTGEDWTGIGLTLSTAKPSLGSLPPKLKPWYVDERRPLPTPSRPMAMRKRSAPKDSAFDLSMDDELEEDMLAAVMAAALPSPAAAPKPAEVATASASQSGAVVTFRVGGGSDIPSDGNPHKVMLLVRDQHPAQWQYIAMPKQVSFAYLQATVQNPSDGVTLLPGKANIFRDGMFVGKTQLQNTAPGQEFRLDLGIDEGIQVERELTERQVSKKLIGGQRLVTYGYRVKLTNLLEEPVELKLSEQLPVSKSEKIKVRLSQATPKIDVGELGLLEWQLRLDGNEQQAVSYQFVVEHPVDLPIMGLG